MYYRNALSALMESIEMSIKGVSRGRFDFVSEDCFPLLPFFHARLRTENFKSF